MAFLSEAEEFLARLPSISLDGMDPMFPESEAVQARAQAEQQTAKLVGGSNLLGQHKACTITTGPQSFPGFEQGLPQQQKQQLAKVTATTFSPNSTLYPLSSLESMSNGSATHGGSHGEADMSLSLCQQGRGNSLAGSCESDAAEQHGLRRSPRTAHSRKNVPKEKRKVGRPIAYCGDPNSPDLTPAERRRIKRRIANRESARRVRARRQDLIEEMAKKAREMEMHNSDLAHHATSVESQHQQMLSQMGEYSQRLQQTAMQNEQLQREIAQLRAFIASKASHGQARGGSDSQPASCAASLPVNHSATGNATSSNPCGRSSPAMAGPAMFGSGLQSAFAASASTLPMDLEPSPMPMLDYLSCMRSGSKTLPSLSNAVSLDQLLPTMEPYGASFNDFLLGEAC